MSEFDAYLGEMRALRDRHVLQAARIVTLEAALRGLCEAYDAQVTVRNTVLFNHACPQSAGAWRVALAVLKEPKP